MRVVLKWPLRPALLAALNMTRTVSLPLVLVMLSFFVALIIHSPFFLIYTNPSCWDLCAFPCATYTIHTGITPIGSSVLKYDVKNTKEDASGVIPMADELQTLMDATFEQNGETSILTFTQKLVDSGMNDQPITDESSWVYAVGLPDNQWEGTHKVHGSFFMPLEENCAPAAVANDEPTADDVPADDEPVVDHVCSFVEPRELWVDKVKLEHYKNTNAGTYTMRLTYLKGNAWVSIG
jgi:hypothetical protein